MPRHAIAKLVMRTGRDQAKTACGSLQLCAGLEAGIEGETHVVAQRLQEIHILESEDGEDEGSEGAEEDSATASGRTGRARGGKKSWRDR